MAPIWLCVMKVFWSAERNPVIHIPITFAWTMDGIQYEFMLRLVGEGQDVPSWPPIADGGETPTGEEG